jgi:hypothetical protein
VRPEQSGAARRETRARHLWTRYRIPAELWDARYATQEGRCKVCHKPGGDLSAPVAMVPDHDHQTGRLRWLTHPRCNQLVGLAEAYLTDPPPDDFTVPAERLAALEQSAGRARARRRQPRPARETPGERQTYHYPTEDIVSQALQEVR